MQVSVGAVGEFLDHVFVVIVAFDEDRLVLCRHKDRGTWETPGDHIEPGESPLEAARRELFEETGILPRSLVAISDYEVEGVAGRLFAAEVGSRQPLPSFEISEAIDALSLPQNLTYPSITPLLVEAATLWRSRQRK